MRRMKIILAIAGALVLPMASAISASHKSIKAKHKPSHSHVTQKPTVPKTFDTWKPDPTLLDNLAQEIQVSSYVMRLPEGYSEVAQPPEVAAQRQNGFDSHVYGINRRSDGTAATLGFTIATPPPGIIGKLSLDDALDGTLEQKKRQWQDFTESPVQNGKINGLAFERVYFKGSVSGAAGTRMAHGFAYVAVDGESIISFQAEDVEPYNDESVPIAQAAVLTFRRQLSQ